LVQAFSAIHENGTRPSNRVPNSSKSGHAV
jgi:hypothetical protein